MMEYATKEATLAFLKNIGFELLGSDSEEPIFLDSPGKDIHGCIVQIHVYQCNNGYYCVDVDGGWRAPAIWNGPKADWDKKDTSEEFVAYLDRYFPGWR